MSLRGVTMPSVDDGRQTRTGGRPAIDGVIQGRCSLSVGNPASPVPSGWQWIALSDVARLESGHTPSRRKPEYWNGEVPWIGIRDATANHGRTLTDTQQHTSGLGIAKSSARILPTNTVCLSRTASVGYVVVMGRASWLALARSPYQNWSLEREWLRHRGQFGIPSAWRPSTSSRRADAIGQGSNFSLHQRQSGAAPVPLRLRLMTEAGSRWRRGLTRARSPRKRPQH